MLILNSCSCSERNLSYWYGKHQFYNCVRKEGHRQKSNRIQSNYEFTYGDDLLPEYTILTQIQCPCLQSLAVVVTDHWTLREMLIHFL